MTERFENLNGIRGYACVGIVLYHIMTNGFYNFNGIPFEILSFFLHLVFLFMIISSFSMCCGYYEQFKENSITPDEFYKKRFKRIWPFFSLLCTLDLIIGRSLNSLFEWFADLTLLFGLIPNNKIEVIGVGWFLGIVFVFYLLFPFFVFIMWNKKRAWFSFFIFLVLHLLCYVRFNETGGKSNIIYSFIFFISGGILYLYREILHKYIWLFFVLLIAFITMYFSGLHYDVILLGIFSTMTAVCLAIKGPFGNLLLCNKVVAFLGSISMEIYLSHMVIFRVIEKADLLHYFGNDYVNYICVSIFVLSGTILFSLVAKKALFLISRSYLNLNEIKKKGCYNNG